MFQIKRPKFIRLVLGFMEKVYEFRVKRFIQKYDERFSMNKVDENHQLFKNFSFHLEAIDVTSHQANRPSGSMQEGKVFFSGKHKLYGFKVEVSARPNGFASAFSKHDPVSTSDLNIIHGRLKIHERRPQKREQENELENKFIMSGKYQNYWGVSMDKGY